MTTPKPSAGALRAAKAILDRDVSKDDARLDDTLALIIDKESGLAELLEAAKSSLSWLTSYPGEGALPAYERMRAAIATASSPNAETVQAYPAGRWANKKGTV